MSIQRQKKAIVPSIAVENCWEFQVSSCL
jgi:hypothetical protein